MSGSTRVKRSGGALTSFGHLPDTNVEFGYPDQPLLVWFASSAAPQSNADGDPAVYSVFPVRWSVAKQNLTNIFVSNGVATATLASAHALLTNGSIYITVSPTSP